MDAYDLLSGAQEGEKNPVEMGQLFAALVEAFMEFQLPCSLCNPDAVQGNEPVLCESCWPYMLDGLLDIVGSLAMAVANDQNELWDEAEETFLDMIAKFPNEEPDDLSFRLTYEFLKELKEKSRAQ